MLQTAPPPAGPRRPATLPREPRPRLTPVQPRTMVEQAAEAIVAAAVRGVFLPDDRLVEAEIARELGVSRVPVREALRLLESQGVVISTPYKGVRLMRVTTPGVAELMRVRLALELLAVDELLAHPDRAARLAALRRSVERHPPTAATEPATAVLAAVAFDGELCAASGNLTLAALWPGLVRQIAVVRSLGGPPPGAAGLAAAQLELLDRLDAGDRPGAEAVLRRQGTWHHHVDFEAATELRRRRLAPPTDRAA